MKNFRRLLVAIVTFLGGLYFFLEFILPKKIGEKEFEFGFYHQEILRGVQVVGVMAIGLGILSILRVHGGNIIKRQPAALNSAALLISFFFMFFLEIQSIKLDRQVAQLRADFDGYIQYVGVVVDEKESKPGVERLEKLNAALTKTEEQVRAKIEGNSSIVTFFAESRASVAELEKQLSKDPTTSQKSVVANLSKLKGATIEIISAQNEASFYKLAQDFINNSLFIPLGAAIFSLLGFYIASAAYRSFRIRSLESTFLMLTAVIVMLGQIPQGSLYISPYLPSVRRWILENLTTPAFRAIYFGSLVAGLAMAIRMWLSLERSPLSDEDGEK